MKKKMNKVMLVLLILFVLIVLIAFFFLYDGVVLETFGGAVGAGSPPPMPSNPP